SVEPASATTVKPPMIHTTGLPSNGVLNTSKWKPGSNRVGCPRSSGCGGKNLFDVSTVALGPARRATATEVVFMYPKWATNTPEAMCSTHSSVGNTGEGGGGVVHSSSVALAVAVNVPKDQVRGVPSKGTWNTSVAGPGSKFVG